MKISSKSLIVVALSLLLLATNSTEGFAASKASKPGTPVKATAADKLTVSQVGFMDESTIEKTNVYQYLTTWAFFVKNNSPSKSANQVRAKISFYNDKGEVLLSQIQTVAVEIKPGKIAYAASNYNNADATITGVARATAEIVSNGWIIPTQSIYQNPVVLNQTIFQKSTDAYWAQCQLKTPCASDRSNPNGYLTAINLSGVFTVRGPAINSGWLAIFLDKAGNPMGGWSYPDLNTFQSGSQNINRRFTMTDFELANIVNYLFVLRT